MFISLDIHVLPFYDTVYEKSLIRYTCILFILPYKKEWPLTVIFTCWSVDHVFLLTSHGAYPLEK